MTELKLRLLAGDGFILLLTSCVPYLCFDIDFVFDGDGFSGKLDSDGGKRRSGKDSFNILRE
jgi:hypothetical protein